VHSANFPACNTEFTKCSGDTVCDNIFGVPPYTTCSGSNGCQEIDSQNYANIMSEFVCESNCVTLDSVNVNFENFSDCVQNLVTPIVCGEAYNKCQLNDGAGNCKSLVDVSPVTKCFNENSACQIMEAGASYS